MTPEPVTRRRLIERVKAATTYEAAHKALKELDAHIKANRDKYKGETQEL